MVPFGPDVAVANVNAGLLLLMAIMSVEVYGVIIAGWASNSKYAFLGAMRASAQMVSYEIAMGFALVVVLMVTGSLNMTDIVLGQAKGMFHDMGLNFLSWNWLPLLPIFVVYFISGLAETNRHPFDVVEGESEIVAGHMIEYSGMSFAMFSWPSTPICGWSRSSRPPCSWAAGCTDLVRSVWHDDPGLDRSHDAAVELVLAVRQDFRHRDPVPVGTRFLPRFRYDQIMRLGWKIFIPVTLVWLVVVGLWLQSPVNIWK